MAPPDDRNAGPSKPPQGSRPHLGWFALAALASLFVLQPLFLGLGQAAIDYSEFRQLVARGAVAEAVVSPDSIHGTLRAADAQGRTRFTTTRVDPAIADDLAKHGVRVRGETGGWFGELLGWVLPVLLWGGIWYMMFGQRGQAAGGMLSIGRGRGKVRPQADTGVTFDDVAGVDEAKQELQEVVEFLKNPAEFSRLGAHMPKGILLVGPPGTGKTLLAKAVAGQAGVPFFSMSGSEFVEMFVGLGAARVRELFEQARQQAPCIIFIDELDALGSVRGLSFNGGTDEKAQTLDQLLAEMDGFDTRAGVIILAATNRPEILDPALLRAGRFDRHVVVDRPDRKGRAQILRVHLRSIRAAADVDPDQIAALTPGFTGADLANLVNEAAMHATRRAALAVEPADFNAAIERIVAGLEKRGRVMSARERRLVAWHEMGHAIVALSLPGADPVHKVSIIPHGIGALGFTMQRPTEDRFVLERGELADRMAMLLGGRAAELVAGGDLSTGAADDLAKATDLARAMVMRYGMAEALGHVVYEQSARPLLDRIDQPQPGAGRDHGEATAALIDSEVRKLLDAAFEKARAILTARRATLERGAEQLASKETLEAADLQALMAGGDVASPAVPAIP